MGNIRSIDLRLSERLGDPEFRREWFKAQLDYGVPEQFRTLRERRELTQTALAQKADMKQSAISRFEKSSDATWNFETLLKLADAMDAQLTISVTTAEDVIDRIKRAEAVQSDGGSSVLNAEKPKRESHSVMDAKAPTREEAKVLEARRWS